MGIDSKTPLSRARQTAETKREIRQLIQEMKIKGYTASVIHAAVNEKLKKEKKPEIKVQTVYSYISDLNAETSGWFLDMMKNQMSYITLHRQNLLEIDLVKQMVYDKIDAEGGIKEIPARTLTMMAKTLHDLISTKSRLEKEIPNINTITSNEVKSPEEMQQLEAAIVNGLPNDLKRKYEELKQKEKQQLETALREDPTAGYVNLSDFKSDQFVI